MVEPIAIEIDARITPFLKWAGGKRRLAAQLANEITALGPRLYIEPFLGGGAVALALPADLSKILADANPHLIDCWLCVQKIPGALFAEIRRVEDQYGNGSPAVPHSEAGYKAARTEFNTMIDNPRPMWARRSALFIFLNARCFNGLWRTNKSGRFNVPFGKLEFPRWLGAEEMARYSVALKHCDLRAIDFVRLFPSLANKTGLAIYADSPYAGTFDGYAKAGFSENDQRLLAEWLELSAERGAAVWATNADTPLIREIYSWAQIEEINEQHSVGSKADRRGKRSCLLIRGGAACRPAKI
jgi:DNA adenine methylase